MRAEAVRAGSSDTRPTHRLLGRERHRWILAALRRYHARPRRLPEDQSVTNFAFVRCVQPQNAQSGAMDIHDRTCFRYNGRRPRHPVFPCQLGGREACYVKRPPSPRDQQSVRLRAADRLSGGRPEIANLATCLAVDRSLATTTRSRSLEYAPSWRGWPYALPRAGLVRRILSRSYRAGSDFRRATAARTAASELAEFREETG